MCVVLSVVLILPVPFGNMGPGIAICMLAFALLERDGKATVTGFWLSVAALVLAWGVILAIVKAVSLLSATGWAFSGACQRGMTR